MLAFTRKDILNDNEKLSVKYRVYQKESINFKVL